MSFFFNINSVNVSGLGKDWTVLKVYCNKGPALKIMSHSESLTCQLQLNKIYATKNNEGVHGIKALSGLILMSCILLLFQKQIRGHNSYGESIQ